MESCLFLDIVLSISVNVTQCFEGKFRFHFQGQRVSQGGNTMSRLCLLPSSCEIYPNYTLLQARIFFLRSNKQELEEGVNENGHSPSSISSPINLRVDVRFTYELKLLIPLITQVL